MQRPDEKLSLKWNEFRDNLCKAFAKLKHDKDFTDVTLVCEDGQQFETHKLVLISSSPFFFDVLKRNKHPHPMIFMGGLKSVLLGAMMDFLYEGEVKIEQNQLESFLGFAEQLQLKDFRGAKSEEEELNPPLKRRTVQPISNDAPLSKSLFPNQPMLQIESITKDLRPKILRTQKRLLKSSEERVPVFEDYNYTTEEGFEELDQKVKSMFEFSENPAPGNTLGRARICKVCGKEGERTSIINHIEVNHMAGLCIPCKMCGKYLASRAALKQHNRIKHK